MREMKVLIMIFALTLSIVYKTDGFTAENLTQSIYFCDFDTPSDWISLEGEGMLGSHQVLILSNTLDNEAKSGEKILLYQMGPDAVIKDVVSHETWEQIVIAHGQLVWLNQDENQTTQCILEKGSYVNRPPNLPHGPFKAGKEGCLMVVRYYYAQDGA